MYDEFYASSSPTDGPACGYKPPVVILSPARFELALIHRALITQGFEMTGAHSPENKNLARCLHWEYGRRTVPRGCLCLERTLLMMWSIVRESD